MTQTQTQDKDKHKTPTAPNGNAAKTDAPKTDAAKTEAPKTAAAAASTEGAKEEGKTRTARKVYLVEGPVREFKNAAEAEKFLNTDPNAPHEFTVIKGAKVEKKQKVSLR